MVRRGASLDADQTSRQLLEERQDVAPLQLTADDNLALRVDAVGLKNRLCDVETDCRNRLHDWLLRIVGALTAPTSVALACRVEEPSTASRGDMESVQGQTEAANSRSSRLDPLGLQVVTIANSKAACRLCPRGCETLVRRV